MIQFDENGVGKCPNCLEYVSEYDRYCGMCGKLLPLPVEIDTLEMQELSDETVNHALQKSGGDIFYTQCGKKL